MVPPILLRRLLVAAALLVATSFAAHANPTWNRTANISDAAQRLVTLHRAQGSRGVIKFLDACYKTHSLASAFSAALEACMSQDYMHTRVLAEIYARLPEEARRTHNAPSAEVLANAMTARFSTIASQYALSAGDVNKLQREIEQHGLPAFMKSVLPARGEPAAGETQPGGERK